MKKLALALALLTTTTVASAHGWEHGGYRGGYHGGYGHGYYHGGYNWVAPAIIGGVIGYELAQPRTVYVQPQVVYQTPYCTPWTETLDQYGVVTRTRTCTQ
jgi:hypothetical protein